MNIDFPSIPAIWTRVYTKQMECCAKFKIDFGKYKDKTIKEIATEYPAYFL